MPPKSRSRAEQWDSCMDLVDSNGDKVSDWCIKSKNDFTAICTFCNVFFNVRKIGKHPFMKHAESLRHVTACKIKKGSSQTQLENILGNGACLNKSSSSSEMKLYTVNNEAEPMSEYEKMLVEKRTKNQEFLKSLGIDEVKHDVAEVIYGMKRKKTRKFKERPDPTSQRVSKRKKEHVDYSQMIKLPSSAQNLRLKFCPTEKSFEKTLKDKTEYESFVEDFNEIIEPDDCIIQTPVLYDKNIVRQLSLKTSTTRICNIAAMSWFPSSENLVLAVGDSSGSLSLSTFKESGLEFYTFPVHSKKIYHLQGNPYNPSHLISSGSDGKVFSCDIQAQIFSEVLNTSSDRGCTYFDFISPSSYIVSLSNGQVIITDSREQHEAAAYRHKTHFCHNHMIHTINMHPVNKNYFVTAARKDPYIYIWDLRHLGTPVIKQTNDEKDVVSAAFSPASGNFLLSKSHDDIRIFDCASMTEELMECYNTLKYTDKKQKDYIKPVWLPNSDYTFACSFKSSPALHVLDIDLNSYETVSDDVQGCKKLFAFHPFQNALACVTTSSKISVYA